MVLKPMRKRTLDAFGGATLDKYGIRYLEAIMENWRDAEATMRRTLAFAGVLVVIFFLLAHAKNAEVSFGPLKLTNVAAVLTLIPTIVAILGNEWCDLGGNCEAYERVWDNLIARLMPSIYDNDLDVLLFPPTVHAFGRWADRSWQGVRATPEQAAALLLSTTRYLVAFVVFLGSIAFFVYAYIYLYGDRHADPAAVTVGLGVTTVFALRSIALVWIGSTKKEEEQLEAEEAARRHG